MSNPALYNWNKTKGGIGQAHTATALLVSALGELDGLLAEKRGKGWWRVSIKLNEKW